jgi:DNA polymerase III subunit epsilon
MKITCIDFETANPFWGSVCAMGLVVIEDGKLAHTFDTLIKPHPGYSVFSRDNIRVHGIKPEMVKDAPEFDAVYNRVKPYIEGGLLAAHNTSFDIFCLKDVLTLYNIPIPGFEYICTCEIARKAWKGLRNYKLKTVSTHLGFKFKHHDAGEDAIACANIIIKAMEQTSARDIYHLAEILGVKIGIVKAGENHILSSVTSAQKKADRVDAREIVPETRDFNPAHALFKKELVFTGRFSKGMTRRQAMQIAVNKGAKISNYVRAVTDFLVQGADEAAGGSGGESSKIRKAKRLMGSGDKIKIISEKDFFAMVGV